MSQTEIKVKKYKKDITGVHRFLNMSCQLCKFNNPKGTSTAVIMKNNKILLVKRKQEPFRGEWDLPGGYMNYGETPEQTLKRELREEFNVNSDLTPMGTFPGTAYWKNFKFSVLSHAFLADIKNENIRLNKKENLEYRWFNPLSIKKIAFDSNKTILNFVKKNFVINFKELDNLIKQLDPSASVNEHNFYKSILNGHCSKKYIKDKLIGIGWIFPRQTYLRKQAVIEDVVVNQTYRGKGYGEEITLDLVNWEKNNNLEVIELTSGSHRIAANSLYKKVGFKLHPTNHYLYKITN